MPRRELELPRIAAWECDLRSGRYTWPEEAEQLFDAPLAKLGATLQELLTLVYASDRETVQETLRQAQFGAESDFGFEFRVATASGALRWLEGWAEVFRDRAGTPVKLTGTFREVAESCEAEEGAFVLSVIAAAGRTHDVDATLTVVLEQVCARTGWDGGQVWHPSADGRVLECGHAHHFPRADLLCIREESLGLKLLPGEALPGRAWLSRRLVWLRLGTDTAGLAVREQVRRVGIQVGVAVPVLAGEEVLAVLEFGDSKSADIEPGLVRMLAGVARALGPLLQRRLAERALGKSVRALGERVKELTALHGAAGILSRRMSDPKAILNELAALLPPAFQYPEVTAARLCIGSLEARTPGFQETQPCLSVAFSVGEQAGGVEVVYLEDRPAEDEGPFLNEERHLLSSLAEMVCAAWESRRAQEALARSEERYRSLVAATAQAIWTTDPEGNLIDDLPGWRAFTGQTREELLAEGGWMAAIHPEDRDRVERVWREAIRNRVSYQVEYRVRAADGAYRHLSARGVPVLDEQGRVREWVGAGTDVSERVHLQQQFLQAQKMEAVGRLAGGVAHDFNNMLAVINGYTELSLFSTAEDDPRFGHLTQVLEAGKRAHGLTRQLLIFSRNEVVQTRSLQLNEVVSNLEKLLTRLIGEHIRILLDLEQELWEVLGDAGQLEQVLMNLAVNARDAMPDGGTLTVTTSNITLSSGTLPSAPGNLRLGEYVTLSVRDTGTGMEPAILSRIFEPFYTTKPAGVGTGLGLATVYGIVEQAEGALQVTSELGQGSCFQIYLPRARDTTVPEACDAPSTESFPGTETILVVEDEPMVRVVVCSTLQALGYEVLEASGAQEALLLCAEHPEPIHLLLTDLVLPELDGRLLAEQVRAERPEIRVVYMTGYTEDGGLGAEDRTPLVRKPFGPGVLAQTLREVLDDRP